MGLFSNFFDDKEREAAQRHREAQQRLADGRRQQERQSAGAVSPSQPRTSPTTTVASSASPSSSPQRASYPMGAGARSSTLRVKKGDTLSAIARQVYGDGASWNRIQEANPIVLKNPDLIHAGLVLRIPRGEGKPLA